MDLVDRFLSQDDTVVILRQLEKESQGYLQELQERSATLQVCSYTADCITSQVIVCLSAASYTCQVSLPQFLTAAHMFTLHVCQAKSTHKQARYGYRSCW